MKTYFCFILFAVLSFGCATQNESGFPANVGKLETGLLGEKIVSPRLLAEPIPFPAHTPFDSDAKKREAYLNGFHKAWDYVASGFFLHATIGVSKPASFEEAWDNGWNDGYTTGVDRWRQEYEKLRKEKLPQSNSSP